MMKYTLVRVLCVLVAVVLMSSCHISRKKPDKKGKVGIINNGSRKDNGLHKGWYKNPKNPHHPQHSKNRGGDKNTTVVIVNNQKVTNGNQKAKGGKGGKGASHHGKGKKGKN